MSEDRLMPEYDRPAACCRRVIIRPGAHGRGGEVGWGGVGCMRDVRSQQSQRFKLFPMIPNARCAHVAMNACPNLSVECAGA